MKEIFVSDLHFFQKREGVIEKQNVFLKKINKIDEPFILYILGDLSFNHNKESLEYVYNRLTENSNCKNIVLIKGNHDAKQSKLIKFNFITFHEMVIIFLKQKRVRFSHVPIVDLEEDELCVHGHLHTNEESHRQQEFDLDNRYFLIEQFEIYSKEDIVKEFKRRQQIR